MLAGEAAAGFDVTRYPEQSHIGRALKPEEKTRLFQMASQRPGWLVDLSFDIEEGGILALVGSSGCSPGQVFSGEIRFEGRDVLRMPLGELQKVRGGGGIGLVFQEPAAALNPVHTIGRQITDVLRLHRGLNRTDAHAEAARLLDGFPRSPTGLLISSEVAARPSRSVKPSPPPLLYPRTRSSNVLGKVNRSGQADQVCSSERGE